MIVNSGGEILTIDSTSKAAHGSLYDAQGRLIVRPRYEQAAGESRVYSYMAGIVNAQALAANGVTFIFMNRSAGRRMIVRQIQMEASQLNVNTAATYTVQMNRVKFSSIETFTGAGALNPSSSFFNPVAKSYASPPSVATLLMLSGGMSTATQFDSTPIGTIAIPARTGSRGTLDFFCDVEEPSAGIVLDHLEGFIWTNGTTQLSNAICLHLDWDEEIIS